MRKELLRSGHVLRLLALILLSLLLAACGTDDANEDSTATSAPPDAQPTVAESGETLVSSPGTSIPANTDMSTAGDASTPVEAPPGIATPAPATPGPGNTATAASPVAGAASPVAGASTPASATPPTADLATAASGESGDGTSGAMVPGTPVPDGATASPLASPASPVADASPVVALTVTGCEVPDVPPFAGDPTTFRLTDDLNFRTGPGSDCDLALPQPIGAFQVVEVIGGPVIRADDGSQWVQIRTLDTVGWIAFEFLEPVEE